MFISCTHDPLTSGVGAAVGDGDGAVGVAVGAAVGAVGAAVGAVVGVGVGGTHSHSFAPS